MSTLIAMALFAFVTSISPGPVNIVATSSGANFGFNKTLHHITGATIGFTSILLLLGVGVIEVFHENPEIMNYLSYIGAAFLLYMSYKIAFSPISKVDEENQATPPTIVEGLLCQWLNPKAWIVAISGVTVFSSNGENNTSSILLFSLVFFVVCFLSISIWAVMGVTIKKLLSHPEHYKIFNLIMGCILASTVIYLLIY
ncbi:amino acid transporter LysE [Pseudoalteromonas sp. PS1M3]|jgi:threonine/homoserine/homoserine lactone efflux protein|uniref:LysE family translocator n=1 Tax=unclassified Pseudoalteromonas TaxID=194690 RepID=UPI00110A6258|nr:MULTISPECIES: LysE family translocator [unclassified Pseudoalteromonas]TMP50594.1 LysE family translocator [Pseudoalteromonas sp. S1688]TMS79812.1 LysE family translocator [Pseudoalteromonas sp. S554]BBW93813.1 amino acid transporter LysE [Pseudoalteromonas sp. PS1M3]|tara:strand:+ start:7479 stop:8075 length:597 start_codon:yes stop_codon:yes gene_type:complete